MLRASVLVALLVAAALAAPFKPPKSWKAFEAFSESNPDAVNNFLVNPPMVSIDKIANYTNLGDWNTQAKKNADKRDCDFAIAIVQKPNVNGTVLVVTNQSGVVPEAIFDNDNTGNAFEKAAGDAFRLVLGRNGAATSVKFQFTIVCALMPAKSKFDSENSYELPIVFHNEAAVKTMEDILDDFADKFAFPKIEQINKRFNMTNLTFPVEFTPENTTSIVPWVQFEAVSVENATEDKGNTYLTNAPLRSLQAVSDLILKDEKPQLFAEDYGCTPALGFVLPDASNTILVVTDANKNVPSMFYTTEDTPSMLETIITFNRATKAAKVDGKMAAKYTFAVVCADFSSISSSYGATSDYFPPLKISEEVEKAYLEKEFDSKLSDFIDNANATYLEETLGFTSVKSGVFFPQNAPQPEAPAAAPEKKGLSGGAIAGIIIGVVVVVLGVGFFCYKRSTDKGEGEYGQVMSARV